MKKIFVLFCCLFLSGCSSSDYFTCKIDLNNEVQHYKLIAEYKIYYKDSFVTKIEKEENYISDNKDTLDYFYEYKFLEYKNLNDLYGEIVYNIKLSENEVVLNSTIDMYLMNVEKMVKDKYLDKDYVISNKLTTSGIKHIYKEKGAICDI